MNEWNIQSRAHACQACEKPFADKELFHTLLFDEKNELRRLDVCHNCWQGQFSEGGTERKNFISYWQGEYEAPIPIPEAIQKETAETLLRKLLIRDDPKHEAACYILAVMLERKRLLKIKEQLRREGKRIFIYEQPSTGDLFTVKDPELQLDQLEEVQRDVAGLLEHGIEPEVPVAQAPTAATEPGPGESAPSDPSPVAAS